MNPHPLVALTIFSPLPLNSRLQKGLKHLRTLIKVGFEKSKPIPALRLTPANPVLREHFFVLASVQAQACIHVHIFTWTSKHRKINSKKFLRIITMSFQLPLGKMYI
jgi:hypothetical protein